MKLTWIILILANILFSKQLMEDSEREILKSIDLSYKQDNNISNAVQKYEDACENKSIAEAC
ncbi:MAG: hypothetical protein RBT59_10140, partial [Arcobacteraceae bacterium]|nr:hypothetical protein [Arcobacteraceae bacterium]